MATEQAIGDVDKNKARKEATIVKEVNVILCPFMHNMLNNLT